MTEFHSSNETICSWLANVRTSFNLNMRKIKPYQAFLNRLLDLLDLDLTEPFDLEQSPASRTMHRLSEAN